MKKVDTAKDYRLLVAEDAIKRLERRVSSWNLPWPIRKREIINEIEQIRKRLLKLKYSFLPADLIVKSEDLSFLTNKSKFLADVLIKQQNFSVASLNFSQKLSLAEIRYSLGILIGLPQRFKLGEENRPEYAVDVVGAEVVSVERLTEKLKVTRASARSFAVTVVTNLNEIKVGEVRAVALLPPIGFHNVISEAMYSSDVIDRRFVGKRVPTRFLSSELKAKVIDIVRGV